MISIKSSTLVLAFFAGAVAYTVYVATNLQEFLIMMFIAFAVPAVLMIMVWLSNKVELYLRRANYYRSDDAWKKNNKKVDP